MSCRWQSPALGQAAGVDRPFDLVPISGSLPFGRDPSAVKARPLCSAAAPGIGPPRAGTHWSADADAPSLRPSDPFAPAKWVPTDLSRPGSGADAHSVALQRAGLPRKEARRHGGERSPADIRPDPGVRGTRFRDRAAVPPRLRV